MAGTPLPPLAAPPVRLRSRPRPAVLGSLRERDHASIALAVVVVLGVALRASLIVQWRPAFVGFPDTPIYLQDAVYGIFSGPLRVGGYAEFLRLMHVLAPRLWVAIAAQHTLGLLSGLLLFGAARRAGLSGWVALAPAAIVILGGSELLLEHAALTEAVFIFLVDLALYALVRAWRGGWAWALLAGVALGAAVDVRTVGLALLVTMPLALVLARGVRAGAWRGSLARFAAVLAAAALPVGGFLVAHRDAVGYGGFTGAGYFDLYARVAPFAECSRFHPPAGTASLCIEIPRSQRQGHDVWEFLPASPAVQTFGEPDQVLPAHGENARLLAFARAAILAQPFDYLEAVGRDLVRIVDPSFSSSPYGGNIGYGNTPASLAAYYFDTGDQRTVQALLGTYYTGEAQRHSDVSLLRSYESATRLEGPAMALVLLLALLAPVLARGDARRAAILFGTAALTLLVAPVLVSEYDYRFAIPAFGALAACAAIGADAIVARLAARRRHRSAWPPAS